MANFDILCDANYIVESYNKSKQGVIWKYNVQQYGLNLLKNVNRMIKDLQNGKYKFHPFTEFIINERGRTRKIKAMDIEDRVLLRNLCDNILVPSVQSKIIYDNGASVKGKGIDFTKRRFETHLHKFYREHTSNDGYILLLDFSKFFDNIRHDMLIEMFEELIDDERVMDIIRQAIDMFKIDVSYMSEAEYDDCLNQLFNTLEYYYVPDSSIKESEKKYMRKSLGIGSQISQIAGIYFPHRIDNFCKIVKGIKFYGRYMDDIYIIHEDKEYLHNLLEEIKEESKKYGLFINEKKTQIKKINKTFVFLKTRYRLSETGKIIKRVNKDSVTRERRKLKSFKKQIDNGTMDIKYAKNHFKTWLGTMDKYMSYNTKENMKKEFKNIFGRYYR